MTDAVRLAAPAKVNLFLEVLGRRESDGYHLLDTVYRSLDLADEVEVSLTDDGRVSLDVTGDAPADPAENLAGRAAAAFLESWGQGEGASVRLLKRIPAGAGLGGGSADAAAVLTAMDRLLPGRAGVDDLQASGASQGADVPFALLACGKPPGLVALGSGVGEQVEPLDGIDRPLPLVVVAPDTHCSTPEVFAALPGDLDGPVSAHDALLEALASRDVEAARDACYNRLTVAAFMVAPELAEVEIALEEAGLGHFTMTGSGSAFFRLCADPDEAGWMVEQVRVSLGDRARAWVSA